MLGYFHHRQFLNNIQIIIQGNQYKFLSQTVDEAENSKKDTEETL